MSIIAYHPCYFHPLPQGHRFPMEKYELLPKQLVYEGTFENSDFFEPGFPESKAVLAVHTAEYYQRLMELKLSKKEIREIGFPLSEALVCRELIIAQGTIQGALKAFESRVAFNIAGGTHHAFSHRGEAFCLLNDQAIAAQYLLNHLLAKRILIIDLDVHQGNGTAEIFSRNPKVYTFSMHGEKNYPFRKTQSDWDIALPDNTQDHFYLNTLKNALSKLISLHKPDFIFYLSGVDVLAGDKLGRLSLSPQACKQRDELVFSFCHTLQIPVQCSMGGGYAPKIGSIIEAHANTYRIAKSIYF